MHDIIHNCSVCNYFVYFNRIKKTYIHLTYLGVDRHFRFNHVGRYWSLYGVQVKRNRRRVLSWSAFCSYYLYSVLLWLSSSRSLRLGSVHNEAKRSFERPIYRSLDLNDMAVCDLDFDANISDLCHALEKLQMQG